MVGVLTDLYNSTDHIPCRCRTFDVDPFARPTCSLNPALAVTMTVTRWQPLNGLLRNV